MADAIDDGPVFDDYDRDLEDVDALLEDATLDDVDLDDEQEEA